MGEKVVRGVAVVGMRPQIGVGASEVDQFTLGCGHTARFQVRTGEWRKHREALESHRNPHLTVQPKLVQCVVCERERDEQRALDRDGARRQTEIAAPQSRPVCGAVMPRTAIPKYECSDPACGWVGDQPAPPKPSDDGVARDKHTVNHGSCPRHACGKPALKSKRKGSAPVTCVRLQHEHVATNPFTWHKDKTGKKVW